MIDRVRNPKGLNEYLTECDIAGFLHGDWAANPRSKLAAQLALALCKKYTRTYVKRAPYPTEDQALAAACNLIDNGWPIEDEEIVFIAHALCKSRLTLAQLEAVAA